MIVKQNVLAAVPMRKTSSKHNLIMFSLKEEFSQSEAYHVDPTLFC